MAVMTDAERNVAGCLAALLRPLTFPGNEGDSLFRPFGVALSAGTVLSAGSLRTALRLRSKERLAAIVHEYSGGGGMEDGSPMEVLLTGDCWVGRVAAGRIVAGRGCCDC